MMDPIITSILDTDAYKLHMQQAVFHMYPSVDASYEFHCRDNADHLGGAADAIREQVELMEKLALADDEYDYLATKRYFKKDYLDWLRSYRFNAKQVTVGTTPSNHAGDGVKDGVELDLTITIRGPWVEVILWEVPLLAIVSEIVHRMRTPQIGSKEALCHLNERLDRLFASFSEDELKAFRVTDFGTRRRYSFDVQEAVVKALRCHPKFQTNFFGTSNYLLAKRLQLPPVGTQAHEWFQAHQQLSPVLRDSQRLALTQWLVEYPQDLHIALTDCLSMDTFLCDFNSELAHAYSGLRHDSGDPYLWARKALEHYKRFGIDTKSKTLVFSDSLDLERGAKLHTTFAHEATVMCGIGTQLTCSIPGVKPLNIVIKMTECDGKPVAKISDAPGKTVCTDADFARLLGLTFDLTLGCAADVRTGAAAVCAAQV